MSTQNLMRWTALACTVALALPLAACGGDDDGGGTTSTPTGGGGGGGTASTVQEQAVESGGLSFSEDQATAKAGKVTIKLTNPDGNSLPHAIEVEGNGVEEETETIQPGGEASVTVDLKPGTYELYCPVDGHRQQGMEATLTVQ